MRVLVVGSDSWAIDQAERALAGHDVRRCHERGAAPFPCARFAGGDCPVDQGVDVIALVRARVAQDVLPGELGVVCGLRAGVPVVAAGMVEGSPFASLVTAIEPDGDLAVACEAHAVVDLTTG